MPNTKQPAGSPFAVFHSHTARRSLGNLTDDLEISVARDKIVFTRGDSIGNIWMTRLEPPK